MTYRREAILKIAVDIPSWFVQQADNVEMAALGSDVERRGVLVRRDVHIDQWGLEQDLHDIQMTWMMNEACVAGEPFWLAT